MESNHRLPDVSQVSLPLDDGTARVAKVGFEPTLDRLSTCSLCLLAYLAEESREPDLNRRGTAYETVLEPGSSPLRSTPGRTRTCGECLHVREVPSPLGHGGNDRVGEAGVEPAS